MRAAVVYFAHQILDAGSKGRSASRRFVARLQRLCRWAVLVERPATVDVIKVPGVARVDRLATPRALHLTTSDR